MNGVKIALPMPLRSMVFIEGDCPSQIETPRLYVDDHEFNNIVSECWIKKTNLDEACYCDAKVAVTPEQYLKVMGYSEYYGIDIGVKIVPFYQGCIVSRSDCRMIVAEEYYDKILLSLDSPES